MGRDQATYVRHINNYIENYASTFSWENYGSNQDRNVSYVFEPARNSFGFKFQTRNVLLCMNYDS